MTADHTSGQAKQLTIMVDLPSGLRALKEAKLKRVANSRSREKLKLSQPIHPVRDANCNQFVGRELAMTKVSMSWWLSAAVQSD
jgi:hypothetical protein